MRRWCAMLLVAAVGAGSVDARTIDHVSLADEGAGGPHNVRIVDGRLVSGGLDQRSVQLLPPSRGGWHGGEVGFRLRVARDRPTFLTARFWGGEVADGNLTLICDGKQVGDRLLSDYDQLDYGAHSKQFPGAFYYRTFRLPDAVTRGRDAIACRIQAAGPIFSYGATFDKFQKPMTGPSRGIYDLYTHEEAWIDGDAARDGRVAATTPRPADPAGDAKVLEGVRTRIEEAVEGLLRSGRPLGQHEIAFLAHFRHKGWSTKARDPRIVPAILKGIDDFAAAYATDPSLVRNEPGTFNPDWFGFGPIGEALASDPAAFGPFLDASIPWKSGSSIPRRQAYAQMLLASREWLRTHRRFYTNQSMIVDCYGIYLANRGLAVVAPDRAWPEQRARRYLYEAVGIEEWRGDDLPNGGSSYDAGGPDGTKANPYAVAKGYHLVTRVGLTRELGYVGNYGEVMEWVGAIYNATRPAPGQPGDPRIRDQLALITRARAPFRYPAADAEGHAAMRMMADIGWRDLKAPGDITYVQAGRNGAASPIQAAVLTGDPHLIGYARQMAADGQLYPEIARLAAVPGFRATYGLLDVIDDVAALLRAPASAARLPMGDGRPDFAFADPENGVVAVKRGDERFYASLWWRGNRGVTGLGRIWLSGPRGNRIATVPVTTRFEPSGLSWTRPDKVVLLKGDAINAGYGVSLAEAGETLPLAKPPAGITLRPGEDSIYAGRGDSYVMTYGGYTVAINMSETKVFDFVVPVHDGDELISHRRFAAGSRIRMTPSSALVFHSGRQQ